MLLPENEIPQVMEKAKAAFPNFSNWKYSNEINEEYSGFSLWGELTLDPEEEIPPNFFVTLDKNKEEWRGYLTVGQPSYLWSSADFGDAYLLAVGDYDSIEAAITGLKVEIVKLFAMVSSNVRDVRA